MTPEEAIKPVDSAIWEMGEAFRELDDASVWVRAHPRLLSIGEIAAHVAYWESKSLLGDFDSPLIREAARYYAAAVDTPFSSDLGAEAVYTEVQRIHAACRTHFLTVRAELAEPCPHRQGWTWGYAAEYAAFHVAYHTGQMYSVRHLLGHATVDN